MGPNELYRTARRICRNPDDIEDTKKMIRALGKAAKANDSAQYIAAVNTPDRLARAADWAVYLYMCAVNFDRTANDNNREFRAFSEATLSFLETLPGFVNFVDADCGNTLLHFASGYDVLFNNAEHVTRLLYAGAFVDARNHYGNTPLLCAIGIGSTEGALRLLGHRANPTIRNLEGASAFEPSRTALSEEGLQYVRNWYSQHIEARGLGL